MRLKEARAWLQESAYWEVQGSWVAIKRVLIRVIMVLFGAKVLLTVLMTSGFVADLHTVKIQDTRGIL